MKYIVDIDGTLCKEKGPYRDRIPIKKNVNRVNNLFKKGHKIFLYTARYNTDRGITMKWLKENGVKYHRLYMGKIKYDKWIDDKSEKWE